MLAGLLAPGNNVVLPCLDLQLEDVRRYSKLGEEIVLLGLQTQDKDSLISELLYDSLNHVSTSLASLLMTGQLQYPLHNSCKAPKTWQEGSRLYQKMISSTFLGKSGHIELDSSGKRSEFVLEVVHSQYGRKVQEGVWSKKKGFYLSR